MLETVQAIAAIVLIDLALSGDNALVIGVVARGLPRSKRRQAIVFGAGAAVVLRIAAAAHGDLALLLFGLALSIPIVLFGSGLVIRILDRFPRTIWLGAVALVLTAADLILGDPSVSPLTERLPFARELLGVTFLAVLVAMRGGAIVLPALATARSRGEVAAEARSRRAS